MEPKESVPGKIETKKVLAKEWLYNFAQKIWSGETGEDHFTAKFAAEVSRAVNSDAQLSEGQQGKIIDAIRKLAGEAEEKGPGSEEKDILIVATFINSCR